MMTHREFEKLAIVIREQRYNLCRIHPVNADLTAEWALLEEIAGDIADVCESSDDSLSREEFLRLCGF